MLFSSLALIPALFLAAAQAKSHKSKPIKTCADGQNLVVIEDGLVKNYREILKASPNVAFAITEGDLDNTDAIENIADKSSKARFIVKFDKNATKALNKMKSSDLKKHIRKLNKKFEKNTEMSLKYVTLHKDAKSKVVKAFEKKGIRIIAAKRTIKNNKNARSFLHKIKKAKKAENGAEEVEVSSGVFFIRSQGVKKDNLKSLIKKLQPVRCSKCFKSDDAAKKGDETDATEA